MINQDAVVETLAFIQDCQFPCGKQDLIDVAEEKNAPDEVLDMLYKLPDQDYLSENAVLETLEGCP